MINKLHKSLGMTIVVTVLLQISGMDLFIAQAGAWAEMIKDRQSSGTIEAVVSTLSGEAPCPRCLEITEEKHKRDRNETLAQLSIDKIKLPLPASDSLPAAIETPLHAVRWLFTPPYPEEPFHKVASPPPRSIV